MRKRLITALVGACLVLLHSSAGAYSIRVDRFEASGSGVVGGPVVDDFDDGLPGPWGNSNGLNTFGVWEDEPGTSFARLESPGLVEVTSATVNTERSDIFGGGVVNGTTGSFLGLVQFESILPAIDQSFYLDLNYSTNSGGVDLTNGFVAGITNASAAYAAEAGLFPGLNFWQFHFDYGPAFTVQNVTGFGVLALGTVVGIDTIDISLQFDIVGAELSALYRFDSGGALLAPFDSLVIDAPTSGFWDIGVSEATVVPIPASIYLLASAVLLMTRKRSLILR